MPSRSQILVFFFLLATPLLHSFAQITSNNLIVGAGLNDGYVHLGICDATGQAYRQSNGRGKSVMLVRRDGSTQTFSVPGAEVISGAYAATSSGLAILNVRISQDGPIDIQYRMYRFDGRATLVSERRVPISFSPGKMAILDSGKAVVIGVRIQGEVTKYVAAILDRNDEVLKIFDFPEGELSIAEFGHGQIAAIGEIAYFVPNTPAGPIYAISDSGEVTITPVPSVPGIQHHKWMFGSNSLVEEFTNVGERAPVHFDLYDPASGRKIASKSSSRIEGFSTACYFEGGVSWFAVNREDPKLLRLVISKLQ